ncbi:GntR family transcriptional regulator [Belnapia sp. T6]|uniref:GntR family transcriptional regulator n=1 Tax=Belnapia mucosa TaxID=2804532 RepID=A0ABS1V1D7_9PROT|nr:GntR family transcriptional regulator [Belnapia mucosa]MBL6455515.1 GntR family transcriptional regulator [Belnapia mucosa]
MIASTMPRLSPTPQMTDTVYESLRDAICDGTLPPDTRLIQDELAIRLGTSRQPVHLALQQLRKEGFVVETGRRGLVVAPLGREFARQLYEMRAALDGAAAGLAAQRAGAAERAMGERIIREGRAAVEDGDLRAMAQADFTFHDFIYGLAGNLLIAAAARMQWHHVRRSIMLLGGVPTRLGPFWDEHVRILEAILAGDAGAATALAQRHADTSSAALALAA